MIVVTGGGGFIGSAIAQELNMRGRMDLLIVDDIDHPEKRKKYHINQISRTKRKKFIFEKNYWARN